MTSATYHRAIATLAKKLQTSKLLDKLDLSEIVESEMLWDLVIARFPEAKSLAAEVERELNYELNYSQCCNAVGWLHKYKPAEWHKFLHETSSYPRIFADFHNADRQNRIRLNCLGTTEDLTYQNIELKNGQSLVLYSKELEVDGVAQYSEEESLWVAIIDWEQIREVEVMLAWTTI
jgi:hypothetical protein